MPFKIVRNDITKVKADVIVNTANPNPICVSGTDLAIYEAAGKGQLLAERTGIGFGFAVFTITSALTFVISLRTILNGIVHLLIYALCYLNIFLICSIPPLILFLHYYKTS